MHKTLGSWWWKEDITVPSTRPLDKIDKWSLPCNQVIFPLPFDLTQYHEFRLSASQNCTADVGYQSSQNRIWFSGSGTVLLLLYGATTSSRQRDCIKKILNRGFQSRFLIANKCNFAHLRRFSKNSLWHTNDIATINMKYFRNLV